MSPKTPLLIIVLTLTVLPVQAVMAQEVEDKAKEEKDASVVTQDVKMNIEGKKTDKAIIKLKAIVVVGEKIGRTTVEAPPSITIIEGEQAGKPSNRELKSVIRGLPNAFAEDGIQLPAVRGIDGTAGLRAVLTAGTQPRVPIMIDDVMRPISASYSISRSSTWDISTVEVARGPQPSSTGRNALAGAIRVYTNDPSFEYETAGRVKGFSADGTIEGSGMVNLPLIENQVAFRGTYEQSHGESFVDVTDPTDFPFDPEREFFQRARGKLLFAPQALPGLEVKLTVDHMRSENPAPGFVEGDPDDRTISQNFGFHNAFEENDQTTYIGKTNYALSEFVDFELRGSFIDNDLAFLDAGIGVGLYSVALDQAEGEAFIRLNNLGFLKRGLIGVIHNTATEDVLNRSLLGDFAIDGEIRNTGLYAEAELALGKLGLVDGLTLIAGGRYEIDDRHRTVIAAGQPVSDRSLSARRFLPKVGLRYTPTDELTLGYTYSESFRAGGVDVDIIAAFLNNNLALLGLPPFPVAIAEFDPESLRQHEIYAKSSLWNDRVVLGASAFYYTYDDAHVQGASTQRAVTFDPTVTIPMFGNVPKAVGYGLEFEAAVDITAGFSVNGALGLLKTEITDAGPTLRARGDEGKELPRAPSTTASLALHYDSGFGFNATVGGRFVGDTVSGLNQPRIDSYTVFDLAGGYEFETDDGNYRIDAFINNITDERYFTFREQSVVLFQSVGRPRTFGLSATYRF